MKKPKAFTLITNIHQEVFVPWWARIYDVAPAIPILIFVRGPQPIEIDWIKIWGKIAKLVPLSEGFFVTKSFDFGVVPQEAFVVVGGKDIVPYISRDDGENYIQVSPNVITPFGDVPEGTKVRLKIHLKTPDSELDNYAFFVK